jgi:hypothetical protein
MLLPLDFSSVLLAIVIFAIVVISMPIVRTVTVQ